MKRNTTRAYTAADVADAEALYKKSGNPMYLVLAIGENCMEPPAWALFEAQALTKSAKSVSLSGNDRAKWGERLDAMFREFFRQRDELGIGRDYAPPSIGSVARAVLAKEGVTPAKHEYESLHKGLVAAWKLEADGHDINGEGVPENARWHRIVREWGDENSPFPYAHILNNLWKLDRLMKLAERHERNTAATKELGQLLSVLLKEDRDINGAS